MSGRGYGRGYRGRGYGGRGRGSGPLPQDSSEENGDFDGVRVKPPQLFPDIRVPDLPDRGNPDLLDMYRMLVHFWKRSPYHVDGYMSHKEDGASEPDNVEGSVKRKWMQNRASLLKVLSLDPTYFPEELYSTKDQRLSKDAGPQVFSFAPIHSHGFDVIERLEELARGEDDGEDGEEGMDEETADRRNRMELRQRAEQLEREDAEAFDPDDDEDEDFALATNEYLVVDDNVNADDEEYGEEDDGGYDEGGIY
eukprot:jgi/Botrbrau1/22197/Bobra.168_1s0028.1